MRNLVLGVLQSDLHACMVLLILLLLTPFCKRLSGRVCKVLWCAAFLWLLPLPKIPVRLPFAVQPLRSISETSILVMPHTAASSPQAALASGNSTRSSFWTILGCLWLLGIAVLLAYHLLGSVALWRKIRRADLLEPPVYCCPNVAVPFIFGLFRPRIILPAPSPESRNRVGYALLHERQHLRVGDPILKFLVCLLVCCHWYNPLVWLAYHFFNEALEIACDEAVLHQIGSAKKRCYADAILFYAAQPVVQAPSAVFFASAKDQIKERLVHIMEYKAKRHSLAAVLALSLALCSCATVRTESVSRVPEATAVPVRVESVQATPTPTAAPSNYHPQRERTTPPPVQFNVTYFPAALPDAPQTFQYLFDPLRTCLRVATTDSLNYVIVQETASGPDSFNTPDAEEVSLQGGTGLYFVTNETNFISFPEDQIQILEPNVPAIGDGVILFSEQGHDYYVYGTFSKAELLKVAESIRITPEDDSIALSEKQET